MKGRLIESGKASGKRNMALDEALFGEAAGNPDFPPTLRLYGWEPACLSLGRRQRMEEADMAEAERLGIDVVKRFGGGSAVYHDKELTYCFVARLDSNLDLSPDSWRAVFSDTLVKLRLKADDDCGSGCEVLPTCFGSSTVDEPTVGGRKWVGSARRKSRHVFLQHGSILMERQPDILKKLVPGCGNDGSVGLKELRPDIGIQEVSDAFVGALFERFRL